MKKLNKKIKEIKRKIRSIQNIKDHWMELMVMDRHKKAEI